MILTTYYNFLSWIKHFFPSVEQKTSQEERESSQEEQRDNKISQIARLIDDSCNSIVTMDSLDERVFQRKLKTLAEALRAYFDSWYCAIGKIGNKYVEDCTASWVNDNNDVKNVDKKFKQVKRVRIDDQICQKCAVGRSLSSSDFINYFGENEIKDTPFLSNYIDILGTEPKNTTIILFRDKNKRNMGYIQLINSNKKIDFEKIQLFYESLTRLILIIHHREASLFKKDYDFFIKAQEKIHNVDELLQDIMKYLSIEFNAGIISYRIPLLVGTYKQPIFYLRDCHVSNNIGNKEDIEKRYFKERLVKTKEEMGGVEKLVCRNHGFPVFPAEPIDSGHEIGVSQDVLFKKETVIIPIIRDHSGKNKCTNKDRDNRNYLCEDGWNCKARFDKYFGIFKLRILKDKYEEEEDGIPEEIKSRLHNLARHISVLFNAIVDKDENESLNIFQKGLNDSSFTDYSRNKDFDLQCAKIIKDSTGAEECAIYKFDKLSNEMVLGASTSKKIQMFYKGNLKELHFDSYLKMTIENCRTGGFEELEEETISHVFDSNEPVYYVRNDDKACNSMMLVPMKKEDGTKLGMIMLIGKGNKHGGQVSKTYWNQDMLHIKFMVDILSRIEESDAGRLVFLMRLSHELRKPITEMVYKNDFLFSTAERNKDIISKTELIKGLKYNTNQCIVFQQIIRDIEATYYMRNGISCNFKNVNVKACLIDAIQLFEQGGGTILDKGLTFVTYLAQMPQMMYVDKERIQQVIINLLKNAIQYSNDYSIITISYNFNENDNCHEIDFQDYGIAIAENEKENIFKLWRRGEAAQKKRPGGTGMGLSIVKDIMEAHGGKCYVKRLNNPTIFTISIPQK